MRKPGARSSSGSSLIERIFEQRRQLGEQIEQVFLSHPLGKVLVTLCGFGPRTGARTEPSPRSVTQPASKTAAGYGAYAVLAPVDRRSGKSRTRRAGRSRSDEPQTIAITSTTATQFQTLVS